MLKKPASGWCVSEGSVVVNASVDSIVPHRSPAECAPFDGAPNHQTSSHLVPLRSFPLSLPALKSSSLFCNALHFNRFYLISSVLSAFIVFLTSDIMLVLTYPHKPFPG